jgi:outer membrane protein OmpA-like peptidoglycan-associated protein
MGLSQRRATNVAAKLTTAGLPAEAISIKAFGESSPAVETPDGVREPLNRRVEITAQ